MDEHNLAEDKECYNIHETYRRGSAMKNLLLVAAVASAALLSLAATPSSAGCTATQNCYGSCFQQISCLRVPCTLTCSFSAVSVSCTGNTTCNVGTNSVQCDNQAPVVCPATPVCSNDGDSIQCGSIVKRCSVRGTLCDQ